MTLDYKSSFFKNSTHLENCPSSLRVNIEQIFKKKEILKQPQSTTQEWATEKVLVLRQNQTDEQRSQQSEQRKQRLEKRTEEECNNRLEADRLRKRQIQKNNTEEEYQASFERNLNRHSEHINNETVNERQTTLETNNQGQKRRRDNETSEQRQRRITNCSTRSYKSAY
ncbi:hypothetical protein ACKWTF_012014 [Chironomus riparius]